MISDWQERRLLDRGMRILRVSTGRDARATLLTLRASPRKKRSRAGTHFSRLSLAPTTMPSSVKRVPRTTLFGRYPKAATNLVSGTDFSLWIGSSQTKVCATTSSGRCAVRPHRRSNFQNQHRQNLPQSSSSRAFPDRENAKPNQEDTHKHCASR